MSIAETRSTETSLLGFGARGSHPVVLKVVRKENSEEWRCGEVLEAFRGAGMIRPLEYAAGAVLLPRLRPGHDLTSLCLEGRDDEATVILASLMRRMSSAPANVAGVRPIDRLQPEFVQFRNGADGFIPASYVDRAEELFTELCSTQRDVRLLHGDLHHYNVLFDTDSGWIAIDPWGIIGEREFEVGAALRNPVDVPALLGNPSVIERRLRTYEARLRLNPDRALKWAFAMTVLGILWPFDAGIGQDLREPFASAARSMHELIKQVRQNPHITNYNAEIYDGMYGSGPQADVEWYRKKSLDSGGPVLELRAGMLDRLRDKIAKLPGDVQSRFELVRVSGDFAGRPFEHDGDELVVEARKR